MTYLTRYGMPLSIMEFDYQVFYRKVKYPRIEIKDGNVRVIVPFGKRPGAFVNKHRDWIERKLKEIQKAKEEAEKLIPVDRSEEEFKKLVLDYIKEAEGIVGKRANKVYFRKMKSHWGSCSSHKNITINTFARILPDRLLKYVIFHEVAHLRYMNHGRAFTKLMKSYFPDYRSLSKELSLWWYRVG
ncbi:DUF45 domain-containing protein [Candidatus Calescamantes bacterium]|nr:DUF45 domain-containing protein [Candidatus Calescamantes bacterium]